MKLAKSLRWVGKRMREQRSLRDISARLARDGHLSSKGKPFSASAVRSMLAT